MTLSTLQSMNVNMTDLAKAFTARAPQTEPAAAPAAPPTPESQPDAQGTAEDESAQAATAKPKRPGKKAGQDSRTASGVDPMAWWGSLTQQFQDIASAAMKDVAAEALKAQPPAPAPAADAPVNKPKTTARQTSRKPSGRTTAKTPRTGARKRTG